LAHSALTRRSSKAREKLSLAIGVTNTAGEQQHWAYLFSAELISKQEAEAWAEQVWPSERSEAS
jgi:hypothetical protein